MPCFINLPLRWIHSRSAWAEWFIAGRMAPEFGLDVASIALPDSWHKELAARFREVGLPSSVHLPFMGINPAVPDMGKAGEARTALRRGAELAYIYGAQHIVGHSSYLAPEQDGEIDRNWMKKSLEAWEALPDIAGAPLFLENTYETSPKALVALAEALQEGVTGCHGIGICFDIGHWHAFAKKRTLKDIRLWLDAFQPFILHLHLHDNDGAVDQHSGLGLGDIPLKALFVEILSRGKAVTATLEPHTVEALVASVSWLEAHKEAANTIGWEPPRLDALPLRNIAEHLAKEYRSDASKGSAKSFPGTDP